MTKDELLELMEPLSGDTQLKISIMTWDYDGWTELLSELVAIEQDGDSIILRDEPFMPVEQIISGYSVRPKTEAPQKGY